MFVSEELRKNNIAEYLLYMWQVEDLIRANGFDVDRLVSVSGGDTPDSASVQSLREWYGGLIEMMTLEGRRNKGHLQINDNILILMSDLHDRIMKSEGCDGYKELYYNALPMIVGYRAKSDCLEKGELESCFEFMYGVWMLRLQGKTLSAGTGDAAERISAFLARLAMYYKMDRSGQLDLEKEK